MIYYNDINIAWLEKLLKHGLLPDGDLSDKSIEDICPSELEKYVTSSPGSAAGPSRANSPVRAQCRTGQDHAPVNLSARLALEKGFDDFRHLWPAFRWLIEQCRPAVVFGEQVASPSGREWLAGVRSDLETVGYEVGGADLCAASVGSPHNRARLYWVGHTNSPRLERHAWNEHSISEWKKEARPVTSTSFHSWDDYVDAKCGDGKTRRIQSGLEPLADGIPYRVEQCIGYGNAIVPQVGALFMRAFMEC